MNPCGGAGGRGGGGGGAAAVASPTGPLVPAGTYTVTLVVDGKTIESKPMKVVMDPAVQMTDVQQKRYFDILMDLHDMQRRGTAARDAMTPFESQMTDATAKVNDSKTVPAAVKTQFADLEQGVRRRARQAWTERRRGRRWSRRSWWRRRWRSWRRRGGCRGSSRRRRSSSRSAPAAAAPDAAQAGGGAGFGGGGGAPQNDVISRVGTVKSGIMAFTEMPSPTLMKQYDDVKVAMPKAIADTNAFLLHAMTVSQALKKYDITLNVPAPIK